MRWRPYVPVHQRKAKGLAKAQRALGKGNSLQPVQVEGRKIAKSFWGSSWCKHFETYSDYANRLPRGRTYARNGSIVHLEISSKTINAMVAGSDLYHIKIKIDEMPAKAWKHLCGQCTSSVTSTIDLLRGKLPEPILATLTDPNQGLFPHDKEIRLNCNCPDWAGMCKHLAAVLYGVGNRLDEAPELLFLLRGVEQNDLIGNSLAEATDASISLAGAQLLNAESGLEDIFGIDLVDSPPPTYQPSTTGRRKATKKAKKAKKKVKKKTTPVSPKKTAGKKAVKKKVTTPKKTKKKIAKKKTVSKSAQKSPRTKAAAKKLKSKKSPTKKSPTKKPFKRKKASQKKASKTQ